MGLFIPIGLILALPTMVEFANNSFPGQELRINNLSSGLFCTMNGLGEVIGPLFGAQLHERFGFRMTSDLTAIVAFAYVLVFFLVVSRSQISRTTTGDVSQEEELKNELLSGTGYNGDHISQKYKSGMSKTMNDEIYSTLASSRASNHDSPNLSESSKLKNRKQV